MVSYNNSNVVQCLRQYDMFANSLNLVETRDKKDMIIKQLTKLENKIIELTNEVYEEEYYSLANKECGLLDEEQKRLSMLIDLINQRLSYIEKRCNNHYQLTGETIDVNDILGVNTLDTLEERIKIIDKYSNNLKLEKELKLEVESLTSKIRFASEKVDINNALNVELEKSFCDTLSQAFEKCGYYSLFDYKDEIEYAYYETEKSLTLAELNLEASKTASIDIFDECKKMLDDIKQDYFEYKEKINILKLMNVFNREVIDYDGLLEKRKEVNELFRHIKNEEFLSMVMSLINKQYNTILMEQQDINTYHDLMAEKNRKLDALAEINDENNSERFQVVLKELIRNEELKQAKILEEQKRIEEEDKKKKLEIERKKHEEILKRQKIIEEARKKEVEKRTKELLEQQQKSVLQPKKRDIGVNFETIKDVSNDNVESRYDEKKMSNDNLMVDVEKENDFEEKKDDFLIIKEKVDIEKELFDEFENTSKFELNFDEAHVDDNLFFDNDKDESKLPNVSIDEYMKNFDESEFKENDVTSLFSDDDFFPNIPL